MTEELAYRLDGLDEGHRVVAANYALLGEQGVLDRLVELLRPWAEQTLAQVDRLEDLQVLACVRGVFGPDDAEELLGPDALAAVAALHQQGLLRLEGPGRFRLLRPLRPYLLERGLPERVLSDEPTVLAFLDALRRHSPLPASFFSWRIERWSGLEPPRACAPGGPGCCW